MAHSLATDFAGMVLGQLARRGSFVIGSSDVCFMEPATGGDRQFRPDLARGHGDVPGAARARHCPRSPASAGLNARARFNQDAVWEVSPNHDAGLLQPAGNLDYLGSIDEGMTYSLHGAAAVQ